ILGAMFVYSAPVEQLCTQEEMLAKKCPTNFDAEFLSVRVEGTINPIISTRPWIPFG
uniref:COesterase domain-containing protein n=1 Tax=Steinernema glaseri TaxID=37863 RepID=A0A1I8AC20_9BILA